MSAITGANSAGAAENQNWNVPATGGQQVDKHMFLQLLVAQLRNQDPLNPTDGTQFVGQLAQFQQMESTLNMGQDVAAIREGLELLLEAGSGGYTNS
jgi:flagellar hook assembly protein FlgD